MSSSVKRYRGGQPNNTNALKHGYYARKLPVKISQELRDHKFKGLEEEKQVIRFLFRRVIELGGSAETLDEIISLLRVTSLAATTLARIVRVEKYAGLLTQADLMETLNARIAEFSRRYPARGFENGSGLNAQGLRLDSNFFNETNNPLSDDLGLPSPGPYPDEEN